MARPHWLVILTAIVCIVLTVSAIFLPQLSSESILEIVIYEVILLAGIAFLLVLVHRKALPDTVVEHNKPWP